jgi:transcriptional regulator with XRE-family HTH domain
VTHDPLGPTESRLRLGHELRVLFDQSPLSAGQVADALGCTVVTVSRILRGESGVKADRLEILLNLFDASVHTRAHLAELATAARRRRPKTASRATIPGRWQSYYRLEETARAILEYSIDLVPGLGQTEEYALGVFTNGGNSPEKANQLLAVRRDRWERLLTSSGPELKFVMGEATIRGRALRDDVMVDQLLYLRDLPRRLPQIEVRIIPTAQGPHPGSNFPFVILQQPAGTPDRVYIENLFHSTLIDDDRRVDQYRATFMEHILPRALPPEETADLLDTVAAGLQRA